MQKLNLARFKHLSNAILVQIAVAVLTSAVAIVMVHNIAFLTQAERLVGDFRIATMLAAEPQDPDIVIAAINEDTLKLFRYRSPVDRGFLANLLKTLDAKQPRAIAVDILFDQPTDPEKDAALKEVIANLKTPLTVSYSSNPEVVDEKQLAYMNEFVPARDRVAAEIGSDVLGTVRWIVPSVKEADGTTLVGFARGLLAKTGVTTPPIQQEIVWHGRPDPKTPAFRTFPAHLVPMLPVPWLKDKIVLIGEVVSLTDRHRTPFASVYAGIEGSLPGIEVHANSVAQLLEHRHQRTLGWTGEIAIVLLFAAIGASLGAVKLSMLMRVGFGLFVLALLWVGGFALFRFAETLIPLVAPTIALGLSQWGSDAATGRQARRQKEFIQGAFSRYLSPKVVADMVKDPSRLSLEGENREMTFIFTDLEGFTTLSEKIDAQTLAHTLNAYLDGVCAAILSRDGTVDKFIGDAVFAIFNAPADQPDHAERAVQCALAIDRFSEAFRAELHAKGIPLGVTRIGVHTGRAVVGNFGSHTRMQYTALGDTVNTASRLEGINKVFGTRICVSESTRAHINNVAFRPIAVVVPKGRTGALGIFEPLDELRAQSPFMIRYNEAYALAEQHDPTASEIFEELHTMAPGDKCVALHLERLRDEGDVGVEMVMHEK